MSEGSVKKRQGRSPAYPSVSLATALEKAQAQYEKQGKYPTPLPLAFDAWGYSPKSSGGRDVRASLRYFGLATFEGEGDKAKVKLTEDALRVLTDKREDQSEKNAIIRRLALNPTAHKKLWSQFPPPDGIKSDASAIHYLVWDVGGFNQTSAETLVAQFKETAAFARLYDPDNVEGKSEPEAEAEGNDVRFGSAQVGDLIQWESGGVLQLERPTRVRLVSADSQWVAVDGSETGIPMSEVIVETRAPKGKPQPPMFPAGLGEVPDTVPSDYRKAVIPLDEGDVTLTYPRNLSSESAETLAAYLAIFFKREGAAAKKREDAIKALAATYESGPRQS